MAVAPEVVVNLARQTQPAGPNSTAVAGSGSASSRYRFLLRLPLAQLYLVTVSLGSQAPPENFAFFMGIEQTLLLEMRATAQSMKVKKKRRNWIAENGFQGKAACPPLNRKRP